MSNEGKNRKPLLIGIIAAVAVLAVLLGILLTQCTGTGVEPTKPTSGGSVSESTGPVEAENYTVYWNLDRDEFMGKSESGMSSREKGSDGYFHIRFFVDGEILELKAADRKTVNSIDSKTLMGLEFDSDGIISAAIDMRDMPLERTAWQFFVMSMGGNLLKANSGSAGNGMEALMEITGNTRIYDMTGMSGEVGIEGKPVYLDRIYAVSNKAGELTHVFIYDRGSYMQTEEGECQHCGKTVSWNLWNKTDTLPTSVGHFKLQNDIQLKGQMNIEEDAKVCLDLNGYRVDGKTGSRVYALFNVGAELALMDSSEAKTGALVAHGKGDQGVGVWVRYGVFYMYGGTLDASDATTNLSGVAVYVPKDTFFYMHGGEIIGGKANFSYSETKKTYSGGLAGSVYVAGKFVMNDGVIRDGEAVAAIKYNAKGEPSSFQRGMGGNIFLGSTGVMELNGGTIKLGKAGNVGANIYMDGASELTINGGMISGGVIYGKGRNGGNLYVSTKSTVTMNGGRIYGGVSCNTAGNVYLAGKFIMNGGIISGGRIHNYKTGVLSENNGYRNLYCVNGNFQMYGGRIYGGVAIIDTKAGDNKQATAVLSGLAVIESDAKGDKNFTIVKSGDVPRVVVGQMLDGSRVGINTNVGVFTVPCKEHNTDNFFSDIEGAEVIYTEKGLALGKLGCLCGGLTEEHLGECDGTMLLWRPWTSTNSLPNTEGYWYLTQDVQMASSGLLRHEEKSLHVRLDLNGKTVNGPAGTGSRVYSLFENMSTYLPDLVDGKKVLSPNKEGVSMQLTVTDSVGTGTMIAAESETHDQGAIFWGRYNDSVINIYGGTFDASKANLNGSAGGMGAYVTGQMNMYGGTFVGGNTTASGAVIFVNKNKAVFNMYGGTIKDGRAGTYGGNIYLNESTMNLYGGTVEGGTANKYGGNIYVYSKSTLNHSGGTVTGGSINKAGDLMGDLGYGGNIYVAGTLNMSGDAEVTAGYVRAGKKNEETGAIGGGGHGGNIYAAGTLNLTGGTVSGGDASNGGNIGIASTNAAVTLNGVQVLDGVAENGGNIAILVRANKLLEVSGETLISGGKATKAGGNIYASVALSNNQDVTVNITGGTITGGVCTGTVGGGNIYLNNTTKDSEDGKTKAGKTLVTITGGTVENGEVTNCGGNIYMTGNTEVVLDGGNVAGGICGVNSDQIKNGGSVYVDGGSFTMKSGAVTGGTATDIAGNFYVKGVLNVSGGTISGGKANQAVAANIGCVNGTLNISGGTIEGGVAAINSRNNGCSVTLSGKPYIYDEQTGSGLKLTGSSVSVKAPSIRVEGDLSEGSKVAIEANGFFSLETKESNKQYFFSAVEGKEVLYGESRLFLGISACLCGSTTDTHTTWCGTEALLWQDWNGTSIMEPGNYVVTKDYTGEDALIGQLAFHANANLNLNGKTIESKARVFRQNNTAEGGWFGITDHVGGGMIIGNGVANVNGDIAGTILQSAGILHVYRGTLAVGDNHNPIKGGGVIYTNGTLNLYDEAVLIGCDLMEGGNGGAVYASANAVLNLKGGRIEGGSAQYGGGVFVRYDAAFNATSGTIVGGTATEKGGAVYAGGEVNLTDVTISGGKAASAGAIYVPGVDGSIPAGTLTMQGGSISGCEVTENGGAIASAGTVTLNGTNLSGNKAKYGGNIYSAGTLTVTDATVSNGTAITGGNIFVHSGTMAMTGSAVSGGEVTRTSDPADGGMGGNIYVRAAATATITGTSVTEGKALKGETGWCAGGNLYLAGNVTLENVTVSGGNSNVDAHNIYSNGTVTIKNSTIENNQTGSNNILVRNGKFEATDTTIRSTVGNSKNIFTNNEANPTIILTDCLVDNQTESGISIYLCNGSFTATGTQITGNGKGRNIYAELGSKEIPIVITLNEGTVVSGAYTAYDGANLCLKKASATLNGAEISGGIADGNGGNIYVGANSELTIQSGTIQNGQAKNGGNLFVSGSAAINGGTVQNGSAVTGGNVYMNADAALNGGTISGGTAEGNGGNVFVASGFEMTILSGTIQDGLAKNAGNIYVSGTVTLKDGTISGGRNTNSNGGSIYVAGTFDMDGGTVENGRTANGGGNFYVNSAGTLDISGGTVTGGAKYNNNNADGTAITHGNIFVVNGTLNISGGEIHGDVTYTNYNKIANNLTLSGTPVITNGRLCGLNLSYLNDDGKNTAEAALITVTGPLGEDSNVVVGSAQYGNVITSNAVTVEDAQYFHSVDENYPVIHLVGEAYSSIAAEDQGKLFMGVLHCECGETGTHVGDCDGTLRFWMPWTDSENLPTKNGHYILMTDVSTAGHSFSSGDVSIVIDLNGKTVTSTGTRMYQAASDCSSVSFKITDSSEKRDGKIKLADGVVKGDQGKIFWLRAENQTLTMYGGTIDVSGCTLNKGLYGLAVSGGTLKLYRGTIAGGSLAENASGAAVDFSGTLTLGEQMRLTSKEGAAIHVRSGKLIDVSGLKNKPEQPWSVGVSGGVFTKGWNETWTISDYFVSGNDLGIFYDEASGELFAGKQYCVCGSTDENHVGDCGGKLLLWQPWTSATSVPSDVTGNYYLTCDITKSATAYIKKSAQDMVYLRIDLNGFKINQTSGRVWSTINRTNSTLVITDTSADKTGAIVLTGKVNNTQGGIWLAGDNTHLVMYAGTINGYNREMTNLYGCAVNLGHANASFTMHGGTILGGIVPGNAGGGAVAIEKGTFTMNAGTVTGGQGGKGGNIMVGRTDKDGFIGTFVMNGGTIGGSVTVNEKGTDGTVTAVKYDPRTGNTNGVNLYVGRGTATLKGGAVIGGTSTAAGGNIYVAETGNLKLEGAAVVGGTGQYGGNICVAGAMAMTSGYVSGGKTTERGGGNLYVDGSGSATLSGGNIGGEITIGGVTYSGAELPNTASGGNISVMKDASLTLSGATVEGGSAKSGGNIYVAGSATFSGGTVKNGSASEMGGNVYVSGTGKLELPVGSSAEIKDGTAGNYGGNIYVASNGEVTMKSGTVSGGKNVNSGKNGGSIFVDGSFDMSGGTVKDGRTVNTAGNFYISRNGALKISGTAHVTGGAKYSAAKEKIAINTGNIYVVGGTIEIEGGTIDGDILYNNYYQEAYNNITLKGLVTINKGGVVGLLLTGTPVTVITVGELDPASSIVIGRRNGEVGVLTANMVDESLAQCFKPENAAYAVEWVNGDYDVDGDGVSDNAKLVYGRVQCECGSTDGTHLDGCTGALKLWKPWTSATTLPAESGYYYLTQNVTLSADTASAAGSTVHLDLAGHTVTGARVYDVADSTVIICNSAATGSVTGSVKVEGDGGLFRVSGGTLTLHGITVTGGAATGKGGAIYVGEGGILNLNKATVSGETYVEGGTVNVNGLTATAVKVAGAASTLNLNGLVRISDLTLVDEDARIATVGVLTTGSEITVTGAAAAGEITATAVDVASAACFKSANPTIYSVDRVNGNYDVDADGTDDNGKLFYGRIQCECGISSADAEDHLGNCGGKLLLWQPWTNTTAAPGTSGGNYYLTCDVTCTTNCYPASNKTVRVDLNGYKISRSTSVLRIWTTQGKSNSHLIITDSSVAKTGAIVMSGNATFNQGGIWIVNSNGYNNMLTLYAGTIDASGRDMSQKEGGNGNAISVTDTCSFEMYGGVIIGGPNTGNGGAVCVQGASGKFTMYGGTITGGSAGDGVDKYDNPLVDGGGNVAIVKSGTFVMHGGTIGGEVTVNVKNADGSIGSKTYGPGASSAYGGNILVLNGTAELKGGTVKDGTADKGGNIYVAATGTLKLEGAAVVGGTGQYGGNICVAGTMTMSSGNISGGTTTKYGGGNIYLEGSGSAVLSGGNIGGEIKVGENTYKSAALASTAGGGGNICAVNKSSLTISGVTVEGGIAKDGGNIYVGGTASLILNGGTITGGQANGNGGNICITPDSKVTFTMDDTTISNGKASTHGGNIYIANNCEFIMNGGSISGGEAKRQAGNLCLNGDNTVTFIMNGGSITGGVAKGGNGGSVYVGKDGVVFTMMGGTVSGGSAPNHGGGNFYNRGGILTIGGSAVVEGGNAKDEASRNILSHADGTLNITGGTIKGHVTANGAVTLSGAPVLSEGSTNLTLSGANGKITVGELTGGSIGITAEKDVVFATGTNLTYAQKAFFFADDEKLQVVQAEGEGLKLVNKDQHVSCLCGEATPGTHTGECQGYNILNWQPVAENTLPTTSGYYYLQEGKSYSLTVQTAIGSNAHIVLDLNGQDIISTVRVYTLVKTSADSSLTILDSQGDGTVQGGSAEQGGTLWAAYKGNEVTLYGGTILASSKKSANNVDAGPAICLKGADMTMHGGTVVGGKTSHSGGAISVLNGATFTMNNGVVVGGTADANGGCITVDVGNKGSLGGGHVIMNGGTISGGSAAKNGGCVAVLVGDFTMNGGSIGAEVKVGEVTYKGGTAASGGNVYIAAGASLNMIKGTIQDGLAVSYGGNIYNCGALQITGGTVSGGKADSDYQTTAGGARGGNICIDGSNATFLLGGDAKVLDGGFQAENVENWGGNIAVVGAGAKSFEITGNAEVSGGYAHRGGNLFIYPSSGSNMTYTISGNCEIKNGKTTYRGGNICVHSNSNTRLVQLNITGGNIVDPDMDGKPDNITLGAGGSKAATSNSYASVVMSGGKVSGGRVLIYKSAVFTVNGGTFDYDNTSIVGHDGKVEGESAGIGTFIDNTIGTP